MKRIFHLMIIVVAAMVSSCVADKDVVKIGVISPMTGAGASCADYWVNGLKLAVEEINSASDETYELIFEDCQSDPAEAISCYKRLELRGVKYVVAVGGQFAMAVAPLTKGKNILYFTSADYNEAVLNESDCAFRVYPSANTLAETAADYLKNTLGKENIAVITMNTVPNLAVSNALEEDFTALGGNVVFKDTYNIGQFDFKDVVNKLKTKKIDAVFLTGFGTSTYSFCNQLSAYPQFNDVVVLGDVNLSTADFVSNMANNPLTVYVADSKLAGEFEILYKETYGDESNSLSSCSYIIPYLIKEARDSADDKDDIKSQLNYIRNRTFDTAMGDVTFDSTGNCALSMQVYRLK